MRLGRFRYPAQPIQTTPFGPIRTVAQFAYNAGGITTSVGTGASKTNVNITTLAVLTLERLDPSTPRDVLKCGTGAGATWANGIRWSGVLYHYDATSESDGSTALIAGRTYILGFTRTSGTVKPRFHIYDFSTGAWVHEDGGTNTVDRTGDGSSYYIGHGSTNVSEGMSVAQMAHWDGTALSDGAIEALGSTFATWVAASPRSAWTMELNPLDDSMSAGADETSRTGVTQIAIRFPADNTYAAGVVAQTITPSGALTPVGALVRKTGKLLAGALTPTGALTKLARKLLGGTIVPAGALANLTRKPLAGTVTPTGALALVPKHAVLPVGAVTPTGSLTLKTGKLLTATQLTAGQLIFAGRGVNLSGLLTPTGNLTLKTAKPFTGAITPAGALTKVARKALTATVATAGALAKITRKALTAVVASAGALVFKRTTLLTGTIAPTGDLTAIKTARKTLTGAITPSGAFLKGKALSGTIAPAGRAAGNRVIIRKTLSGTVTSSSHMCALTGEDVSLIQLIISGIAPTTLTVGSVSSASFNPTGITPTSISTTTLTVTQFSPSGEPVVTLQSNVC